MAIVCKTIVKTSQVRILALPYEENLLGFTFLILVSLGLRLVTIGYIN